MRHSAIVRWPRLLGGLAAGFLAGCGGSGGGAWLPADTLSIASTSIVEAPNGSDLNSTYESADLVNWEIPLAGGCGGPYVVKVLSGQLPPGIAAADGTDAGGAHLHHLRGALLSHGTWSFRLEVLDTQCNPFAYAYADFTWTVSRGRVAIVGAEPEFHPPGTYVKSGIVKNPNYPALADTVFGTPVVHNLIVGGGTPPYSIELIDDPANPEDGLLPQGVSIPSSSASIVGAPGSIRDREAFVFTIRATDGTGQQSAPLTLQWEVTAPPILIADDVLPSATCGRTYGHQFTIVDGVPPFEFEFVTCDVDRDVHGDPAVIYSAGSPAVITPACATQKITATGYPAANLLGPDYRAFSMPPEGLFLGDGAGLSGLASPGLLTGAPRRRGTFRMFLHVRSTVVPNSYGQHAWKMFELQVAPSEPPTAPTPAFDHDPAYTLGLSFPAVPPYARIADAEAGAASYNPDGGSPGLQLKARGGVRKDGRTDAPHASQVGNIEGYGSLEEDGSTPGGGYDWTVEANPVGDGDAFSTMPPGLALDGWTGVWRVTDTSMLMRQQPQALEFTVRDQQLPTQVRNVATRRVTFGVGPDKLIYTESTTSGTTTTASNWLDMNDGAQTVRVCLPYTGVPVVFRDLLLSDLSPTHTVPSTTGLTTSTGLATLLTSQDMLRVCVNPAGWWDDVHALNPNGARSGTHADANSYDNYIWGENDNGTTSDLSRQPSITAVDVPAYRAAAFNAVSHAPSSGIYTDGGKLYPFANTSYFGVFIVRSDATIYVPFALGTTQNVGGQTFTGFGDGCVNAWAATGRSQLRIPHMAVSPDGRFAAMKIKTSETNFFETAATTKVVVFSLTGEKVFGSGASAQTWCIVDSGSAGSTSTGVYLYAPSMVMTNSHLYFLCGNLNGTLSVQTPVAQHFVYRFQFADPATGAGVAGTTGVAALLPKAVPTETDWTNTSGSPLQTRFQLYTNPLISGYTTASFMHFDGGNLLENSICPLPFRVSADGRSIAILAMPDQAVANANSQAWHVWVDFQGGGVRKLSSAPRHVTGGATRGYTLGRGSSSNTYENWHRYGGPTPQMEISDDGSKVAVVANRFAGTPTYTSPTTSWVTAREDVIAYRTSDNVNWTEIPVTGDGGSTTIFSSAGSALWRFGSLVFTKDNAGLVFWGGASSYYAASTTSSYQISHMLAGSIYGTDISTATAITGLTVTSLLATTDGGSTSGVASFTTAVPYNPALPAGAYAATFGVIKPYGGFLSRNREFLYMVNKGALVTASNEYPLVGVNIRSTNTGASINGRTDFRGFTVGGWPARRGFLSGTYNYYAQYGLSLTDYPCYRKHGMGKQVMPKGTGWVLFGSQYQSSGPTAGTASSSYGGPINSTYSYDYAAYGGQIEGFNADVGGPVVRLSSFTGDTSLRRIRFLEPSDGGGEVAFVYDTYATTNASPSTEQLHALTGIGFNAGTGAATSTPVAYALEGTSGRISDAFAFGSGRDRLYYAAGSSSNENAKTLKEATLTPSGVTYRTLSSTAKRYNVLHVAR